jgi:adenine-specific DNA-methyltransferase
MNNQEAIKLLNDTFNKEFNLGKFTNFLSELFNGFYPQPKSIGIHKEYEQHIVSISKLGNYKQDNKSMEIMVVKLKKGTSLDRARTMQRNVIAKLLKNFNIDSSLVAFTSEGSPDWRFSFVKMDYKLTEDGKVSEELTPAKRYSFLVGPNEPNHTCRSQFIELIKTESHKPSVDEIENAFSIERVTKEFFEKYKNLYYNLKNNLDKLVKKDKNLSEEFEDKQISTIDFSKKLLGQIVFLYFLQKKGWLGVRRGEKGKFEQWGEGSRKFIQELFYKSQKEKKNFFNDYLEPLFYHALATDRRADEDYYEKFDCKIPFLNGGLFEPLNGYNWGETDINLDNDIFEEIFKTFDEFNFTIKEDEPLEKEVAVDPEMLGKVFENLLDVEDRKSKGAFYTPREIVHYMCQQSLINYLETNTKISREDLEFFIQKGDISLEYLRRQEIVGGINKNFVLSDSIRQNAKELDKLLVEIKICDPAVGSGAFPVGMMNEIIKARTILSYILKQPKTDYELKRETIENSLYGVDIEPSAVEITKLRFWLSLIVDEEDMNNIKPLPNLENKIMCGNSLIEEFEGIKLYIDPTEIKKATDRQATLDQSVEKKVKKSEQKLKELRQKQKEFFDVENRTKKKQLREEIDKIEWEFIEETLREQGDGENMKKLEEYKKNKSKPFFLWKLYFSDVFHRDNPGFDVVLGNPPYVSAVKHSKENAEEREFLRKRYSEVKGSFDLYSIFLLKGLELIRNKGVYSWIIPNKFLVSDYSIEVLKKLKQKGLYSTIDVSKYNVFHDIGIYPIILLGDDKRENDYTHYEIEELSDLSENTLKEYKESFSFDSFEDFGIKIGSGTTGFQATQIIPLIKNKNESKKGDIPFAVSGSIDPYLINMEKVRYMGSNYTYPYISFDPKILAKRKWDFWKNPKIVVAGMTKRIEAYYSESPLALGVGCYAIFDYGDFNPKFLLGILNSKFLTYYLNVRFKDKHLAGGYLAINKSTIEKLPIKKVSPEKQRSIVVIVDKILSISNNDDYLNNKDKQAMVKAYENRIDKMVYEIYELSSEDIKTIENTKS